MEKRLGILGGTFDPVHNGHLAFASQAMASLDLNRVTFIPAPSPPHKKGALISSFPDRLAMIEIAIKGHDRFFVSEMESERPGRSYTIDTLKRLRKEAGGNAEIFFLLGMDAFLEIHTWKDYQDFLQYAHLAVANRPPMDEKVFSEFLHSSFPSLTRDGESDTWRREGFAGALHLIRMEPVNISSTGIREAVAMNRSIGGMVPPGVDRFIEEKGLYRRSQKRLSV